MIAVINHRLVTFRSGADGGRGTLVWLHGQTQSATTSASITSGYRSTFISPAPWVWGGVCLWRIILSSEYVMNNFTDSLKEKRRNIRMETEDTLVEYYSVHLVWLYPDFWLSGYIKAAIFKCPQHKNSWICTFLFGSAPKHNGCSLAHSPSYYQTNNSFNKLNANFIKRNFKTLSSVLSALVECSWTSWSWRCFDSHPRGFLVWSLRI